MKFRIKNGEQLPLNDAWKKLEESGFAQLRISDIWLSSSDSFIGKLIRWGTHIQDGDPVRFNHVAGYTGSGNILEAIGAGVTERSGSIYFRSFHTLRIIRNVKWTQRQRAAVLFQAKKYQGMPYAYGKVFILQTLDCIFRTDMFTRNFSITALPYCSQLWASAQAKAGIGLSINGKSPESVCPDDWDDESLAHPEDWVTVLEHDGKNVIINDLPSDDSCKLSRVSPKRYSKSYLFNKRPNRYSRGE
jgi:hypothetical protein